MSNAVKKEENLEEQADGNLINLDDSVFGTLLDNLNELDDILNTFGESTFGQSSAGPSTSNSADQIELR
jgi:hypothetical protein